MKNKGKKIEIFKLVRPAQGHYLIMEVIGMPNGKTIQVIRLGEKHTLKIVNFIRLMFYF